MSKKKQYRTLISDLTTDPKLKLGDVDPEFLKIPWVADLNSIKMLPAISPSLAAKIKKVLQ